MREVRYVYLKCDRAHEKHVASVIFVYRLCVMFALGSIVGILIGLLSR